MHLNADKEHLLSVQPLMKYPALLLACLRYTLLLVQADKLEDQVNQLAVDFSALNAKDKTAAVHAKGQ